MHLRAWNGKINLLVITLDDFELILGIDFPTSAKAMVIPHLGGLVIMDEAQLCFVAGVLKENKDKEPSY